MSPASPLRVLALLEADSITGTAKPVLEMGYEARADTSGRRGIRLAVANFSRGTDAPENSLTRALRKAQIPFSFVRERRRFDPSVIPQIRTLIQECDAEVVWTNSVKSHFLVNLAGVPKTCKWVAFHHGYTLTDFKMRIYNELDRISLRRADRVLTVCRSLAVQMEARGVSQSRIRVQHMPVRPFVNLPGESEELRAEFSLPADAKVILCAGRLSREKGHAGLIQAFAQLRRELKDDRFFLVLVGGGVERARLEREAAACHVREKVIFAGHRDDAKRFYGIATIFALPSFSEGTPNVLLEAMAAGVPVVATAVGGVPELATDGRHALLVEPGDPAALANALKRLIQSPALRNELPAAARAVVAAHAPNLYFDSMQKYFLEAVDG